jgi:hypothetical protein
MPCVHDATHPPEYVRPPALCAKARPPSPADSPEVGLVIDAVRQRERPRLPSHDRGAPRTQRHPPRRPPPNDTGHAIND